MIINKVIDYLFPFSCLSCNAITKSYGICDCCFNKVNFISKTRVCQVCSNKYYQNNICQYCTLNKPYFTITSAALEYDDFSRNMLLKFKLNDDLRWSNIFARWMFNASRLLFTEADIILPVPLHWQKLLKRRYNQTAILANILGQLSGIEVNNLLLFRSIPRVLHSDKNRFKKLSRAFQIRDVSKINEKSIILIDDVMSSGDTVNCCAKLLLDKGAELVKVIVLARNL